MQVLPLLVQLSDLRSQGAVHQHVHLPTLRHEPALRAGIETESPGLYGRGFLMSAFLLIILVFVPHGEFAASGESGFNSQKRQKPAIQDKPGGKDAKKNQQGFHHSSTYLLLFQYISTSILSQQS
jgi:hypothetical protein